MKTKLVVILIAFSVVPAWAQPGVSPYYQVEQPTSGRIIVIPAGTTFEGRIDSTIGSSVSKQGERFNISISSPVLANGSDVLIPIGATVIGEVVQAIPHGQIPHKKKEKPPGQLRVQITALKMPDGTTFPMVAALTGEVAIASNNWGGFNSTPHDPTLGSGVGYVGTQSGFNSVSPRRNSGVVTKQQLMADPIMGRENIEGGRAAIRSLVRKNRELYIYSGSPLTIRLEAPFKIGMSSSAGEASALGVKPLQSEESSVPTQIAPPANPIQFEHQPVMPKVPPIAPQHPSQFSKTPVDLPQPAIKPQDSNF